MNRQLTLLFALLVSATLAAAQQESKPAPPAHAKREAKSATASKSPLKSEKDKVSYSIGLDIGRNLKAQGIEIDAAHLARGMKDAQSGAKPLLTDEEVRAVMVAFQSKMRGEHAERAKKQGDENKAAGEAFLAKNKSQEGVKTTASGLQYKVLKEGTGKMPGLSSTVTAHYRGTLLDGKEFDSSYKRGQPANFPVSGVIPGWTEALQMMKVGSKWQVWIPSNLGYGERGAGAEIGPNAMLTFEIELIDVKEDAK
jgi:FKBP-type peptidyl-prolyl cis-trans isomerase FklB